MAGDWIKVECTTPDKPEIDIMAKRLGVDHDTILGKCLRVWIWANQQSLDGNALSVTETFLDRLTYCPGFSDALRHAGWLTGSEGVLAIPNFTRHNGQPAKKRALTKIRVEKTRKDCNAASVTKALPEKRREEKSITNTETQGDASASSVPQVGSINAVDAPKGNARQRSKPFQKPTVSDVVAYVLEINATVDAKTFVDYYESNGWRVGRNSMKDWKATVRQWENRRREERKHGTGSQNRVTAAVAREQQNASTFDSLRRARERAGIPIPSGNIGSRPITGHLTGPPLLDEANGGTHEASE